MTNAERFLDAFAAIEKHLRRRGGKASHREFSGLLQDASASMPEVRHNRVHLQEYADLRNAIVHERTDGHPIAEPRAEAVSHLQRLRELVLSPPPIGSAFIRKVSSQPSDATIGQAVSRMLDHTFSQLPILESGKFCDLLTTNCITRWLGAMVKDEIVDISSTPISQVLPHKEKTEAHAFLSRQASMYAALDRFESAEREGKRLEAILITEHGRADETLLGILTAFDLPKVYAKLKL